MIKSLHIDNYALIDELDIDFYPGFSVITGETGAGKSIILGAIGLLVGQRSTSNSLREGEKTVIEATFDVENYNLQSFFDDNDLDFDGKECVVRREITQTGKSRAFINDTPASLSQLKELGDKLLDVHSQHQNLLLNKENFQLSILDILAGNEKKLAEYKDAYKNYKDACRELADAIEQTEKNKQDEDYLRFQLDQLQELNLREGEQTELEDELEMLSHAEEIREQLNEALRLICSDDDNDVLQNVRESGRAIQRLTDIFPSVGELGERLESCYIELKDISDELDSKMESVESNPKRLDKVNERLSSIYSLEQKHRVDSVEALIALQKEMEKTLKDVDQSEEHIEELKSKCQELRTKTIALADVLSIERGKAAKKVEQEMVERLLSLGMPNVRFQVSITDKKPTTDEETSFDSSGKDKVEFLFSANKNMPLQNLSQVASGGEIARVMLSLKAMIAGAVKMPTIIFDEIDTGVSGSMADKMARIMREMGDNDRQVISITHLPQIAALGKHHYKVYKSDETNKTTTHIVELEKEQRISELANMLSGETTSQAALDNARELLNQMS